jgi:serine phosphatase RsbU (regulator of sigma subunit)
LKLHTTIPQADFVWLAVGDVSGKGVPRLFMAKASQCWGSARAKKLLLLEPNVVMQELQTASAKIW